MNLLLSALGVSIFLQNLVPNYQGVEARSFDVSSTHSWKPPRH